MYRYLEALLSFPPAGGIGSVWGGLGGNGSSGGGGGGGSGDDGGGMLGDGHLHTPSCVPQPTPSRTCTIASLTPAATEIVHALGLQSRLVCVTDRCNFPPSVARSFPIVLRSRSVLRGAAQAAADGDGENNRALSRLNPTARRQSIGSAMMNAVGRCTLNQVDP